jgi:hypothetical protein
MGDNQPMKCAECDCDNPPHGCNWIKSGPSLEGVLRVTGPNSDGEYWLHLKDGVNDLGMNLGADHGIIGGKLLAKAVAIPAAPMGVKVKPLEWARSKVFKSYVSQEGYTVQQEYDANGTRSWAMGRDGVLICDYASYEEALAAAQADYEARILAALTPQPAPTLRDALELPEIRALVDAARPFSQVTIRNGVSGAGQIGRTDVTNIRAALEALQTEGGA